MAQNPKPKPLSQARLKALLHYDPETGIFTWRVDRRGTAKAGMQAGWVELDGRAAYIRIRLDGRSYSAHRLVWLYVHSRRPAGLIKHINQDGTDNRIANLRDVTRRPANNTSGCTGVHRHKPCGNWCARIEVNRRCIDLGLFDDLDDAVAALKKAETKNNSSSLHGS